MDISDPVNVWGLPKRMWILHTGNAIPTSLWWLLQVLCSKQPRQGRRTIQLFWGIKLTTNLWMRSCVCGCWDVANSFSRIYPFHNLKIGAKRLRSFWDTSPIVSCLMWFAMQAPAMIDITTDDLCTKSKRGEGGQQKAVLPAMKKQHCSYLPGNKRILLDSRLLNLDLSDSWRNFFHSCDKLENPSDGMGMVRCFFQRFSRSSFLNSKHVSMAVKQRQHPSLPLLATTMCPWSPKRHSRGWALVKDGWFVYIHVFKSGKSGMCPHEI